MWVLNLVLWRFFPALSYFELITVLPLIFFTETFLMALTFFVLAGVGTPLFRIEVPSCGDGSLSKRPLSSGLSNRTLLTLFDCSLMSGKRVGCRGRELYRGSEIESTVFTCTDWIFRQPRGILVAMVFIPEVMFATVCFAGWLILPIGTALHVCVREEGRWMEREHIPLTRVF